MILRQGPRVRPFALFVAAATSFITHLSAQTPPAGPAFDVVSIKPHVSEGGIAALNSSYNQRPDGGLIATNIPAGTFVARAYPPVIPRDIVGLPSWAMTERYDVSATSPLSKATPEERAAMLRAMLADRFKLIAHMEKREQPAYDLVLARSDGRLGSGLTPSDLDCVRIQAERAAVAEAALLAGTPPPRPEFPQPNSPPPQCSIRIMGSRPPAVGDKLEGETTMANLAEMLNLTTGRFVVDKTGLPGSYRMTMTFDRVASLKGPDIVPAPDALQTVYSAIREQLGLRLEPSRAVRETLVIDRLERPSEN